MKSEKLNVSSGDTNHAIRDWDESEMSKRKVNEKLKKKNK